MLGIDVICILHESGPDKIKIVAILSDQNDYYDRGYHPQHLGCN